MKLLAPFLILAAILMGAMFWDDTPPRADVVIVNRGEVFTLDPQRMSYVQDFRLAYALYEGLVRWNNDDFTIEPAAAELPEVSEDQRTYTFRIKPQARWSNGDPVTAHDFVFAWQRLLWPDTAADYSNLFFVIDGAQTFFEWRNQQLATQSNETADAKYEQAMRQFEQTVGVTAMDDRTLQIRLSQPTPYFLDLLCFAVASPVHRPSVEGWPDSVMNSDAMRERGWIGVSAPDFADRRFVSLNPITSRIEQRHDWARPGQLVSNGPYVLSQWRYKRDMRLDRNPHFHNAQAMRNNSVLLVSIEDANTSVLGFESGAVDWLVEISADYQSDMLDEQRRYEERHATELMRLLNEGLTKDEALAALPPPLSGERRNVHAMPTFGTDFYNFNCRPLLADGQPNPFADARVRRAFALAIDKNAIVERATRLHEPVMNALIPPDSIVGYRSPAGLSHDVARAQEELAAAGWRVREGQTLLTNESGESFPEVDVLYTSGSSRYRWMTLELKSQWEKSLGVSVRMRAVDTKFYKEDLKQGKYMISRGRWYGDYGDPTTFLDINRSTDGNNDRGFSSARYDELLNAAASEVDSKKRLRMLEEAERIICEEELPLLPICQLVQLSMYEPGRLRGLSSHPRLVQYLWELEAN